MRSPSEMGTIQIDITNACTLQCSNCTRFCGNHSKPFFMNYEDFKNAVDSLDGFNGVTGVMGGEPTLHPEFERFVLYLQKKFGKRKRVNRLLYPQNDFIWEIRRREIESSVLRERPDGSRFIKTHGPGLWSNMSASYLKYYELIQDTFEVQYLNDHMNPSYHQPGLFSRRDLGITDEEWIPIRDKCWIQNEWSATITPKGAFFCEIAGALDMLFNGPGGWKVEKGWWRRTPEDFKDQLHWCEICGFALSTFVRNAEEETDDVSPYVYEKLKALNSPKLKSGRINIVQIKDGVIAEESKAEIKTFNSYDRYMEHYEDRFSRNNSILYKCDYIEKNIDIESGTFGVQLNELLNLNENWILLKNDSYSDDSEIKEKIGKVIWNPGCLHIGKGYIFFNKNANSIKEMGYQKIANMKHRCEFIEAWQPDKIISLTDIVEKTKLKLPSISPNVRYVIWGAGLYGEYISDAVKCSGGSVPFIVDNSCEKQGTDLYGSHVFSPDNLLKKDDDWDILIIAHFTKFEEIEKEVLNMGISKDRIRLPYEM